MPNEAQIEKKEKGVFCASGYLGGGGVCCGGDLCAELWGIC